VDDTIPYSCNCNSDGFLFVVMWFCKTFFKFLGVETERPLIFRAVSKSTNSIALPHHHLKLPPSSRTNSSSRSISNHTTYRMSAYTGETFHSKSKGKDVRTSNIIAAKVRYLRRLSTEND